MNQVKITREPGPAFTLIELLVVIAIIGVLAGLLLPVAAPMMRRSKIARVQGELNQYVTAIESYNMELRGYPPDNGLLEKATTPQERQDRAAKNPLFYELSGAVFQTNRFQVKSELIQVADLKTQFNLDGIQNSARTERDIPFKGMTFKASQYKQLAAGADVQLLNVPVTGAYALPAKVGQINPWFYDSSTTNRHNRKSFDLWAEVKIGNKTNVIGNWKE